MRYAFVLVLVSLLASCFSPTNLTTPTAYQLTAVSDKKIAQKPVNKTLLVSSLQAASGYQSTGMLYRTEEYRIDQFTQNTWNSPPGDMIQPLLVQSLNNAGYFKTIIPAPNPASADLRLDVVLIELQQDFTHHPSQIEMSMRATLINDKDFVAIASRDFSFSIPAQQDNPYGGVVAANEACRALLQEISLWTVQEAQKYYRVS